MAKTKKPPAPRPQAPKLPVPAKAEPVTPTSGQPFRETVESFAIAIVLAFLIRTFAAEAFVIPTGSMANTLMGQHQDVFCEQCGQRYRVSASDEQDETILKNPNREMRGPVSADERWKAATIAGTCPTCRDTMIFSSKDIPQAVRSSGLDIVDLGRAYGGDRILVNKYVLDFQKPERWDVVVFKFPGDANTNYIKRLVALPNEEVRIYHGDLFIGERDEDAQVAHAIERKPASKVLAMRELVHDTDHDAAALYDAGWPLRWQADGDQWKTTAEPSGKRVVQEYELNQPTQDAAWLRYRHRPPELTDWLRLRQTRPAGEKAFVEGSDSFPEPELVGDFNPYNSNVQRRQLNALPNVEGLENIDGGNGIHWVGDLILEADVNITSDTGELLLDLVKGGRHFVCRIDVATGKATLGIEEFETRAPVVGFAPQAETSIDGAGEHQLRFAHVDEQLLLWVDGDLIEFSDSTAYDYEKLFGDRQDEIPGTSASDPGDLAPAAIGARNATLTADRLHLARDIYYIAANDGSQDEKRLLTDYPRGSDYAKIRLTPQLWDEFRGRDEAIFPLRSKEYFVMGDNSPYSLDARLWYPRGGPGGSYLDENLLIGKAVFVYWPHSWWSVPYTPIPLWPNFRDMRLVR
ncbi:MAG: signal peptidase I [Pirellulales bacterium]